MYGQKKNLHLNENEFICGGKALKKASGLMEFEFLILEVPQWYSGKSAKVKDNSSDSS